MASESEQSSFTLHNETALNITTIIGQLQGGRWTTLLGHLTPWQVSELKSQSDTSGLECLLNSWFGERPKLPEGEYCNATWDNIYCWPATPVGTVTSRTCKEVFSINHPNYGPYLTGNAWRVCTENGTWLWNAWTNYTECADSYEDFVRTSAEEKELDGLMQYILFIGSILSLCFLLVSVAIFSYFKSLRCDRITIHVHLMCALILRYILLIVITEPFVFDRATNYRTVDLACKAVISIYLFSTMTSINWMFIQGVYINGKITNNVFDRKAPFKVYHTIGWVVPAMAIVLYVGVMETKHPVKCWKGYSDMAELWIVLAPMLVALVANFLFLMNILRALLSSAASRVGMQSSEITQFRKAAKATAFLIPLLGVNNLLFVYNPGGNWHKFYVIFNALFGSTQGIFVSVVYCFLSNDVKDAFRRLYHRHLSRRSASRRCSRTSSRRHLHVVWSRRGGNRTRAQSTAITEISNSQSDVGSFRSQNVLRHKTSFQANSPRKLEIDGSRNVAECSWHRKSEEYVRVNGRNNCLVTEV